MIERTPSPIKPMHYANFCFRKMYTSQECVIILFFVTSTTRYKISPRLPLMSGPYTADNRDKTTN